jgi:hypothetical protein
MWYERNINVFRARPLAYVKHNTNDNLMLITIFPSPLFIPTFQNQTNLCKKPYFVWKFAKKYRPTNRSLWKINDIMLAMH